MSATATAQMGQYNQYRRMIPQAVMAIIGKASATSNTNIRLALFGSVVIAVLNMK
ncbi:MAG: hypothetical protein MUP14_00575 [Dehalococcoidia bacterium]|nr:hypothetical protein [Dehalococcoidia bacterium]